MRIVITYQQRKDLSYLPLIDMAFASAKRLGYETVIVDSTTIDADHKIDFPAAREPFLMNWILAAQLAYIESPLFDCPSVLFSPDALILKPLAPVFEQDFHIGFTDRSNPRWPINNGVIYLHPERRESIAALWRDALAVCKSYPTEIQEWYGDQQSLWDIYRDGKHLTHGLKVALLPCTKYNASPKNFVGIEKKLVKDAYVAHFKGKRKNSMQPYWSYLCSKDL